VPFAFAQHLAYGRSAAQALAPLGLTVEVATADRAGADLIAGAEALFVGGGNTFRLLKTMQVLGVLPAVRQRFERGELLYMGASAGTNLACPTIRTTNDMPIVVPDGLDALGLVPFQINAHFQDDDAFEGHMGETRRTRLHEFLDENDVPVLAVREGAWVSGRSDGSLALGGENGAVLFRRTGAGVAETEFGSGTDLSELTSSEPVYDSYRS